MVLINYKNLNKNFQESLNDYLIYLKSDNDIKTFIKEQV